MNFKIAKNAQSKCYECKNIINKLDVYYYMRIYHGDCRICTNCVQNLPSRLADYLKAEKQKDIDALAAEKAAAIKAALDFKQSRINTAEVNNIIHEKIGSIVIDTIKESGATCVKAYNSPIKSDKDLIFDGMCYYGYKIAEQAPNIIANPNKRLVVDFVCCIGSFMGDVLTPRPYKPFDLVCMYRKYQIYEDEAIESKARHRRDLCTLVSKAHCFGGMYKVYNIPTDDIDAIKPWLLEFLNASPY